MKVVLGVCGFGLGHSTRERPILEGLLARGHDVVLVTRATFFSTLFPGVPNAQVHVPAVHTTPDSLDPRDRRRPAQRPAGSAGRILERVGSSSDVSSPTW